MRRLVVSMKTSENGDGGDGDVFKCPKDVQFTLKVE